MKYLSIDVETTGLDPQVNNLIEFTAILFDTEQYPHRTMDYCSYRLKHDRLVIDEYCYMNASTRAILEAIYKNEGPVAIINPKWLWTNFQVWKATFLDTPDSKCNLAGKNLSGFDLPFLRNLDPAFATRWHHHRILDPGPSFYQKGDDCVPDLATCMKRSELFQDHFDGLSLHNSWDDAYITGCLVWEALNRTK